MKKKFFTKASPKVSAVLDPSTGLATVVVQIPTQEEDRLKRRVAA
jgi:hypothetical protein